MKSKRVWICVFVSLMFWAELWGVQSAIAANKEKSVGTKAPAQTYVVKEDRPSQAEEKVGIFPQLGHTAYVISVAFSPDGRFALSGAEYAATYLIAKDKSMVDDPNAPLNVQLWTDKTDDYFNGGVVYEIPSGNDQFELEVSPPYGSEFFEGKVIVRTGK